VTVNTFRFRRLSISVFFCYAEFFPCLGPFLAIRYARVVPRTINKLRFTIYNRALELISPSNYRTCDKQKWKQHREINGVARA
jgi:hypothetical protein